MQACAFNSKTHEQKYLHFFIVHNVDSARLGTVRTLHALPAENEKSIDVQTCTIFVVDIYSFLDIETYIYKRFLCKFFISNSNN